MASAIMASAAELTAKENAIVDIGAWTARGEQDKLGSAFKAGFDAGLTLNEAKELVGQLYAYCGFPRALNAAGTLMKVAGEVKPTDGSVASMPRGSLGERALPVGTANQTKLCGGPVKGALFDFHPQLDEYLKTHLFGDIFARDVLDWRTREIVTIAALAARPETEPQMKAHIIGNSYLHKLTLDQVPAFGVTFEPGCRNNWHIHHAKTGGGQMLIVTAGEGFYQERGKPARRLKKGDTVNIPANVKHWHGAAPDSWFQHIALEVPGTEQSNEWCEPVDDATK